MSFMKVVKTRDDRVEKKGPTVLTESGRDVLLGRMDENEGSKSLSL